MALKLFPFPIFAHNPTTNPFEVRFSRWNNANAEKFNERRRSHPDIEDDLRRIRRFDSTTKFPPNYYPATPTKISETQHFKDSRPDKTPHPAFRSINKTTKFPPPASEQQPQPPIHRNATIRVSEDGLSYVVVGAPFEFKYSYTETPKVKPLKLREAPFSPFGPTTMGRPWTGRAPSQPTKKKVKEFDSFVLPPPDKKGVKPVQRPGPFLPGSGPRYVYTREEILGEPLTKEEIEEMVNGCLKSTRQLNMGRDGLTHNMLDNIHAHWKRRRVCKIKCKGVCTVDMDNVCQQLEERTGGKIIYKKGGVLYLFRGRNYNYKTRPRFPLMLWRPATPMYPRLIARVPEGLTPEEATEMRKKGRELIPICKLGKNGVYSHLARQVREAFEECELVKINCQGMNGSDYRKIGAKLRDLVPCVLISFEREHILMWRGRDWKSIFTKPLNDCVEVMESSVDVAAARVASLPIAHQENEVSSIEDVSPNVVSASTVAPLAYQESKILSVEDVYHSTVSTSTAAARAHQGNEMSLVGDVSHSTPDMDRSIVGSEGGQGEDITAVERLVPYASMDACSTTPEIFDNRTELDNTGCSIVTSSEGVNDTTNGNDSILDSIDYTKKMRTATSVRSHIIIGSIRSKETLENVLHGSCDCSELAKLVVPCMEGITLLLKQAVENGRAVVLDDAALDADTVFQRAVAFARSAPPDPVYARRNKQEGVQKDEKQEDEDLAVENVAEVNKARTVSKDSRGKVKSGTVRRVKEFSGQYLAPAPQGTLGIDELAKLLA